MKRLNIFIIGAFVAMLSLVPIGVITGSTHAQAVIDQSLCGGANLEFGQNTDCDTSGTQDTVNETVSLVINIFSWIVGVVSVIMIIYGGFRYITSGGSDEGVKNAKNTILYAIVGLVIVALAQIIVKFVLGTVTDVTAS